MLPILMINIYYLKIISIDNIVSKHLTHDMDKKNVKDYYTPNEHNIDILLPIFNTFLTSTIHVHSHIYIYIYNIRFPLNCDFY